MPGITIKSSSLYLLLFWNENRESRIVSITIESEWPIFYVYEEHPHRRISQLHRIFCQSQRGVLGLPTSFPVLLMSKPSPHMCTPDINRKEWACLMSQNWTVSSQPPLISSCMDLGLKQALKTRDLWPSILSGISLQVNERQNCFVIVHRDIVSQKAKSWLGPSPLVSDDPFARIEFLRSRTTLPYVFHRDNYLPCNTLSRVFVSSSYRNRFASSPTVMNFGKRG